MEEITILNFIKRTPHIKSLHDLHIYAIYVYAKAARVYNSNDFKRKKQKTIPFFCSEEEHKTHTILVKEAVALCNTLNKSYVDEMGKTVIFFRRMSAEKKIDFLKEILLIDCQQ